MKTCLDCAEAAMGAKGACHRGDCPCCSPNPTPDPPGPDTPKLPQRGKWQPERWRKR